MIREQSRWTQGLMVELVTETRARTRTHVIESANPHSIDCVPSSWPLGRAPSDLTPPASQPNGRADTQTSTWFNLTQTQHSTRTVNRSQSGPLSNQLNGFADQIKPNERQEPVGFLVPMRMSYDASGGGGEIAVLNHDHHWLHCR